MMDGSVGPSGPRAELTAQEIGLKRRWIKTPASLGQRPCVPDWLFAEPAHRVAQGIPVRGRSGCRHGVRSMKTITVDIEALIPDQLKVVLRVNALRFTRRIEHNIFVIS